MTIRCNRIFFIPLRVCGKVVFLQGRFAIQRRQRKTVSVDAFDSDDKTLAGVSTSAFVLGQMRLKANSSCSHCLFEWPRQNGIPCFQKPFSDCLTSSS